MTCRPCAHIAQHSTAPPPGALPVPSPPLTCNTSASISVYACPIWWCCRELEAVRTHRAAHRTRRQDAPIPVAAIVGYTNAGRERGPQLYIVLCLLGCK